jgi:hypothetical protein
MAKLKSHQLRPRGKKGIYSLRISIGGKDIWCSTKTANLKEAKERAELLLLPRHFRSLSNSDVKRSNSSRSVLVGAFNNLLIVLLLLGMSFTLPVTQRYKLS